MRKLTDVTALLSVPHFYISLAALLCTSSPKKTQERGSPKRYNCCQGDKRMVRKRHRLLCLLLKPSQQKGGEKALAREAGHHLLSTSPSVEASPVSVYPVHRSSLSPKRRSALHPASRLSSACEVSVKKGQLRLRQCFSSSKSELQSRAGLPAGLAGHPWLCHLPGPSVAFKEDGADGKGSVSRCLRLKDQTTSAATLSTGR